MRFAWIGCHAEGLPALEAMLAARVPIAGVITLRPELAQRHSGAVDYAPVCGRYGVPLHSIGNINHPDGLAALRALDADVAFVIGWSQILSPAALGLVRVGMIGAHASLLPHNRGSAPVNWALIRGAARTGNSLIWLAADVDGGAIIDQTAFPITPYDTCATLYERVAQSNRDMLLRLVPRLVAGERPGRPQPATDDDILPPSPAPIPARSAGSTESAGRSGTPPACRARTGQDTARARAGSSVRW
jgi:methionyl-tRNA formyltransferase